MPILDWHYLLSQLPAANPYNEVMCVSVRVCVRMLLAAVALQHGASPCVASNTQPNYTPTW